VYWLRRAREKGKRKRNSEVVTFPASPACREEGKKEKKNGPPVVPGEGDGKIDGKKGKRREEGKKEGR